MSKRVFDLFFSSIGLLLLSPIFLVLALLVKLSDGGPIFFRQKRIGQGGTPFLILKFRSMVVNAEAVGLSITAGNDPRITRVGRLLRKSKLDELPQLWNVFIGEMSFVGPRPEVPKYVEKYTLEQQKVLLLKPGITDLATLEFRNEEELLQSAAGKQKAASQNNRQNEPQVAGDLPKSETEKFYVEYCIPRKIQLNLAYADGANLWEDTKIILRTLFPRLGLKSHVEGTSEKVI